MIMYHRPIHLSDPCQVIVGNNLSIVILPVSHVGRRQSYPIAWEPPETRRKFEGHIPSIGCIEEPAKESAWDAVKLD